MIKTIRDSLSPTCHSRCENARTWGEGVSKCSSVPSAAVFTPKNQGTRHCTQKACVTTEGMHDHTYKLKDPPSSTYIHTATTPSLPPHKSQKGQK